MVFQQFVVGNLGEIVELKIINEHRKTFFYVLVDDVPDHKIGLSRTGSSCHQNSPKGIDDIDPAFPYFIFQPVLSRQVNGEFIFQ
ncbi:hypothetical protein D3C85_1524470 [compost metagenome]